MLLYDLSGNRFPSPLSAAQIGEQFHAGRLHRDSPCRVSGQKEWRTVDELFPLLKYDSSPSLASSVEKIPRRSLSHGEILFGGALLGGVLIAAYLSSHYFWTPPPAVVRHSPLIHAASPQYAMQPAKVHPDFPPAGQSQPMAAVPVIRSYATPPPLATPAPAIVPANSRAEDDRLRREKLQQEQAALAERMRDERRAEEVARVHARGINHVIPLDEYSNVPVGGIMVQVMIHDNDTTSFDVWLNGSRRHEVKKEKGITASGTDETLIYSGGNARLYYVWEISGKLNHCLLRVREN